MAKWIIISAIGFIVLITLLVIMYRKTVKQYEIRLKNEKDEIEYLRNELKKYELSPYGNFKQRQIKILPKFRKWQDITVIARIPAGEIARCGAVYIGDEIHKPTSNTPEEIVKRYIAEEIAIAMKDRIKFKYEELDPVNMENIYSAKISYAFWSDEK